MISEGYNSNIFEFPDPVQIFLRKNRRKILHFSGNYEETARSIMSRNLLKRLLIEFHRMEIS